MAETPNYGLALTVPQFQVPNFAQAYLGGVAANQDQQRIDYQKPYYESQTAENNLNLQLKQYDITNKLTGSVMMADPQSRPAMYKQNLAVAEKFGLDTSGLPQEWGPDAEIAVKSAYISSGQAMAMYTQQAKLAMAGLQMQNLQSNIQKNNFDMGLPYSAPNNAQAAMPGSQPAINNNQTMNAQPGMQGQPMPTIADNGQANIMQPSNTVGGPAGLAGNKTNLEEQAKNWQTLLDKSQAAASQYEYTNAILNQTERNVNEATIPGGPVIGHIRENTPSGQLLDKNSSIIQQNLIKQLASSGGLGRIMQSEIGIITKGTPENTKYDSVNLKIVDNLKATNEIVNKVQPRLLMQLNNLGIRDPNIAGNVLDEVLTRAKVFDHKTGDVDVKAFDRLPDVMNQTLDDFKQGKLFNPTQSADSKPSFKPDDTFTGPNGIKGTYEQLQEAAKANKMSPEDFIKANNLQPLPKPSQSANNQVGQSPITQVAPKASPELAQTVQNSLPVLNQFGINTPQRQAAFLGQITHETAGLQTLTENSSGKQYDGRKDLGNTESGDGPKYKGRGFIQLTGRSNYEKYGNMLGVDLVSNPELAARPDIAIAVAAAYWNDKRLNELADKGDYQAITKRINGGVNGYRSRVNYTNKYLGVLQTPTSSPQQVVTA